MALKFYKAKWFLSYVSKQSKCYLDQKLKNRLAYLNFDANFEFLKTIYCKMHVSVFKVLIILR